jgi:hypothetical protein
LTETVIFFKIRADSMLWTAISASVTGKRGVKANKTGRIFWDISLVKRSV